MEQNQASRRHQCRYRSLLVVSTLVAACYVIVVLELPVEQRRLVDRR